MATARAWEAANGLPREIADLLGGNATLLLAIPEHKVALPGGSRPSQCDVFALTRSATGTTALAVEAKVDEPFGPTLRNWLDPDTSGKRARLQAIIALLGCSTPPDCLHYQLFHRSASAVIEAGRFGTDNAAIVVQSFSPQRRWFVEFAAFCAFLGHDAIPDQPMIHTLPDGRTLTLGWASGDASFLNPL